MFCVKDLLKLGFTFVVAVSLVTFVEAHHSRIRVMYHIKEDQTEKAAQRKLEQEDVCAELEV